MSIHNSGYCQYAFDFPTARHTQNGRYCFDPYPIELEGPPTNDSGRFYAGSLSFIQRGLWESVRGLDEGFEGWGFEDSDFRKRLVERGESNIWIGGDLEFLHTRAEESSAFYAEKDVAVSKQKNMERMRLQRPVNPNGFGVAMDFDLFEN